MNIGQAIIKIRKKKGLKQKEFAKMAGISINALCAIENNRTEPKKKNIKAICEAFDIPTSYLLAFSVEEQDVPKEKWETFSFLSKCVFDLLIG